ncbi:MAG: alpha/beta hydrolase [Anaerolineaceae bacterium]
MHKKIRFFSILLVFVIVILTVGFVIWGETPSQPMPEALTSLQSDSFVNVTPGKWITFSPVGSQPTTGFIIYPGGRVDYRSYAPAAHQIASQGFLVIIVRMPLNLAVINPGAATDIISAHPEITQWSIGGHSLGGAMAANFAKKNQELVQGLVLWAAYPASSDDLSDSGLSVISIYGTLDGLATLDKINLSRSLLPADTTWLSITGGNHAQFGWYGDQSGDNPAKISRADQQDQIVSATISLLENLN